MPYHIEKTLHAALVIVDAVYVTVAKMVSWQAIRTTSTFFLQL